MLTEYNHPPRSMLAHFACPLLASLRGTKKQDWVLCFCNVQNTLFVAKVIYWLLGVPFEGTALYFQYENVVRGMTKLGFTVRRRVACVRTRDAQ